MNYDLAMMALEGLTQSPVRVRHTGNELIVEGSAAGLRELARLFLLLGSEASKAGEELELIPDTHLSHDSMKVRLRKR